MIMDTILQLHISLSGSQPLIWRRVLVPKNITFYGLHLVIQTAMGWEESHLYEFYLKGARVGQIFEDGEDYGEFPKENAESVRLEEKILEVKQKFDYLYDFGDSWEHQIKVEKALPADATLKYPHCLAGAMNCPPEDSGGLGGFYYSLEVLQDKKHPEYSDLKAWYGRYNPERFKLDAVNVELRSLGRFLKAEGHLGKES